MENIDVTNNRTVEDLSNKTIENEPYMERDEENIEDWEIVNYPDLSEFDDNFPNELYIKNDIDTKALLEYSRKLIFTAIADRKYEMASGILGFALAPLSLYALGFSTNGAILKYGLYSIIQKSVAGGLSLKGRLLFASLMYALCSQKKKK